jgi:hypothetical protein
VNEERFQHTFAKAWTHLVTADRFDGPTGNLCRQGPPGPPMDPANWFVASVAAGTTLVAAGLLASLVVCIRKRRQAARDELDYSAM